MKEFLLYHNVDIALTMFIPLLILIAIVYRPKKKVDHWDSEISRNSAVIRRVPARWED
jgi:hypothetical protein